MAFLEWLNCTKTVRPQGAVGDQPNVPKRLDSHELNSHKHGQTCAHSCPSPSLGNLVTQHIQGLFFIAWDELLNEWLLSWMPLCAQKGASVAWQRKDGSGFTCCRNTQWSHADIRNYLSSSTKEQKSKDEELSFLGLFSITIGYYYCWFILHGRPEDPLCTHSLFGSDWLVWETLEYNLLALTCSLKKALSTGIRLSWQGQLKLTPTVSLYVSITLVLLYRPSSHRSASCP